MEEGEKKHSEKPYTWKRALQKWCGCMEGMRGGDRWNGEGKVVLECDRAEKKVAWETKERYGRVVVTGTRGGGVGCIRVLVTLWDCFYCSSCDELRRIYLFFSLLNLVVDERVKYIGSVFVSLHWNELKYVCLKLTWAALTHPLSLFLSLTHTRTRTNTAASRGRKGVADGKVWQSRGLNFCVEEERNILKYLEREAATREAFPSRRRRRRGEGRLG